MYGARMSAPRVTAIIVSYKSAALTVACVNSLAQERARTQPGLRCLIVDNASGDREPIAAAIEANGWADWVDLIEAPRNGGFAYGNNVALCTLAKGAGFDYAYLINPDAMVHPGAIDVLVDFMEAKTAIGIAGGIFENPDGTDWAYAFNFPSVLSELESALQLGVVSRLLQGWRVPVSMGGDAQRVDWISGAAMMIRREVFQRIGGFDEGFFLYFEETEFCFRAALSGFEVWYVPGCRVTHIGGQSTGIGVQHARPKRLPGYWYESRRRYFRLTHSLGYAATADFVALLAGVFGLLKRICTARFSHGVPRWLRDLYAYSFLRTTHRREKFAPLVPSMPPSEDASRHV